jgi:hypothetical protein
MIPDFDLDLALLCARLSAAAYELDDAKRQALVTAAGAIEVNYVAARNDARLLVAQTPSIGIIHAFQGTQFSKGELASIVENLRVDPIFIGNERRVLEGYWDQLQALIPFFAQLPLPDLCTGHSMGGAIASLAQRGRRPPITFGAPKAANAAFWHSAEWTPQRVVRAWDFAPGWPLLPLDYVQPGPEFWLHHNGHGPLIIERVAARPGLSNVIEDHAVDLYVADLAALAPPQPAAPKAVAA